jgi:mannose-6-phosphate isomerase-like protein (cupin superfamily)
VRRTGGLFKSCLPDHVVEKGKSFVKKFECRVNDALVKIGVADKEHTWHKHDTEDKFFYVVEGRFRIELAGETVELAPQQSFMVPKGVMHRTCTTAEQTVMLIVGAAAYPSFS